MTVNELDDGCEVFARVAARMPAVDEMAVGARTWGSAILRLIEAIPVG